LDNRIVTSLAGIARKIGMHRDIGSKKVVLWGTLPLGDPGVKEALAIEDPAELTAQLFHEVLERRGINVSGKSRARHQEIAQFYDQSSLQTPPPSGLDNPGAAGQSTNPGPTLSAPQTSAANPKEATVLADHTSLSFIEDVRVINKTSQNLHA